MLVYFSGSARDIERDIEVYRAIKNAVYEAGAVIGNSWMETAVHIGGEFPNEEQWWEDICANAQNAIKDSDVVIVEASGRSTFGVGYEVALAFGANKRVLALLKEDENSSYIRGLSHPRLKIVKYNPDNVSTVIADFLESLK